MLNSIAFVWVAFFICLVLIAFAGSKLSQYGDIIADKTGLGGTWVGLVMLGAITSLPELVTGISSVTLAQTPEIAAGDVLGSCVFNLLIIVVIDFLHRKESIYRLTSQGHILSAGFGVMLIGFAGFSILLAHSGTYFRVFHMNAASFVIILMYLIAMRTLFRYETSQIAAFTEKEPDRYPGMTLKQAVTRYIGASVLVVATGSMLPFIAKAIALHMGWHESFVGTLFVAMITSLPELVVTFAAIRLGALDMAIGNLLGSNLFNIMILAIDDIFYLKGPLLANISVNHAVSALSAVMMTGMAIIGLFYRPRSRVLKTVGWVSIALFSIYLLNTYVQYMYHE